MFSARNTSERNMSGPYTKYGECRCCMAKGQHRDITKEYYYNNIKEVYRDIFWECFNLSLKPHSNITSLICWNCVDRLRDAASFRMMVVGTEEQLLKAVVFKCDPDTTTEFVDVPDPISVPENLTTEIKIESDADDSQDFEFKDETNSVNENGTKDFDTDENCNDNESIHSNGSCSTQDDEPLQPLNLIEGESKLLARFPKPVLLPTRRELNRICPEFHEHLKKLEGKIVKPQSIEWFFKKPDSAPIFISEKLALAVNATTLFEFSNATAFKTKMRNGYPCFYCREIFNYDKLREHQEKHPKPSIYKLLCKYNADEFIVYADITDLKCTICNKNIKNLNELKTHLQDVHDKKIYLDYPDRIIPFKLKETDLECQICGRNYETFGALERHMNSHYRNFICEECGAGFITKHRLTVHNYNRHKNEKVICSLCKKNFTSQLKYKLHYDSVHRMLKKYKCPRCPEKFIDYFTRKKHLIDIHAEEPILYKCNVCDKGFHRKYCLSLHVKRSHLEQRDIKCNLCTYTCYTKTELKDHMIKHDGAKFECSVCKKMYGRHRSLTFHMRVHSNETRYTCSVCGLSFVQMSAWKSHMKSH